jgi:hypothetical protein
MWSGSGAIPDLWTADGVSTNRYLVVGMGTSTPGIGAFCHESGHMVCGWPDLYDYGGDSEGVGRYCLMANFASRTNPVEPCAYLKDLAGWAVVTTLSTPANGLSVPSSSTNTVYKFEHPTAENEYFLIENRRQAERDTEVPDHGLAIWHCDTNGRNSWNQMTPEQHYEVTLVQADGRWDMEMDVNEGDHTDLYAAPGYINCTPCSNPDTDWWDGQRSDLYVNNISESVETMTFDFNIPDPPALTNSDLITVTRTLSDWTIRLELDNTGAGDAYIATAYLVESLPWLTITDNSCAYGRIRGHTSHTGDPDQFVLDLSSWPGGTFDVTVYITWKDGCGLNYADFFSMTLDPPTTTPVAFEHIRAAATAGAVEVLWEVIADETFDGFNVYRRRHGQSVEVQLNSNGPLAPTQRRYIDRGVEAGAAYHYAVAVVMPDGSEMRSRTVDATPVGYITSLGQNRPNPFNRSTALTYRIGNNTRVNVSVYDVKGRLIRTLVDEPRTAGVYTIAWNGRDDGGRPMASGVYFCRLEAGKFTQTRRMMLLR